MAKTSVNIQPCQIGSSEAHNRRTQEYMSHIDEEDIYVREDLSPLNYFRTAISHSLSDEWRRLVDLYEAKVGQKMQTKTVTYTDKNGRQRERQGSSPIREAVIVIKEDTTPEDVERFAAACHERWGITPLQVSLHMDEGHYQDPDVASSWKPNLHAHVVFGWLNEETGRTFKLNDDDMSAMQDLAALHLGMERGESAKATKKKHIAATQFRIVAKRHELDILNNQVEERSNELQQLTASKVAAAEAVATIKEVGRAARDLVSGKGKREKIALEAEICRLSAEIKKLKASITEEAIKSETALNDLKAAYYKREQKAEAERRRIEAEKSLLEARTTIWKQRFATLWPAAPDAIAAIVERCTIAAIRRFSQAHIDNIEAALRNATSMTERRVYADDLWRWAVEEMPTNTYAQWIDDGREEYNALVEHGEGYQYQQAQGLRY